MEQKAHSHSVRNLGISLLMVLLIVLCFAVFAILSLATANEDYSNSKAYAERKASYYEACNESEQIIEALSQNRTNDVEYIIKQGHKDASVSYENGTASWSIPFSKTQSLCVTAIFTNSNVKITKWQTNLIGGNDES